MINNNLIAEYVTVPKHYSWKILKNIMLLNQKKIYEKHNSKINLFRICTILKIAGPIFAIPLNLLSFSNHNERDCYERDSIFLDESLNQYQY